MCMIPVCVGFDYHDDSIRICVMSESGKTLLNRSVANSAELVIQAVSRFSREAVCAVEACCGAADFAHELSRRTGWTVRLAHPGYARRLKQSPDKSDHDDAQLLADLVRVKYLPEVWLAPTEVRELRRLVRYRQQLKRSRVELKLQIRALLREERVKPPVRAWTRAWRAWLADTTALGEAARWILQEQLSRLAELDEWIKRVHAKLDEQVANDPMIPALEKHNGVGRITAVTLSAEIGSWRRFRNGKELARYCGVTPCNASSGKRVADAGLVKSGNRELRGVLIEAAHRLAQHDERWRALRDKMRSNGKPYNVAMAAIANRWIRWLHHQMIEFEQGKPSEAAA